MAYDGTDGERTAESGASVDQRPGLFARISIFFRQVIAELRKVVTPTRQELLRFTGVVLAFVCIMMAVVYGLDWVFSWLTTQVFGIPD